VLCAVLGVQRSRYYAWPQRPVATGPFHLRLQAQAVHRRSRGSAGTRTLAKALGISRWRDRQLMQTCHSGEQIRVGLDLILGLWCRGENNTSLNLGYLVEHLGSGDIFIIPIEPFRGRIVDVFHGVTRSFWNTYLISRFRNKAFSVNRHL